MLTANIQQWLGKIPTNNGKQTNAKFHNVSKCRYDLAPDSERKEEYTSQKIKVCQIITQRDRNNARASFQLFFVDNISL